MYELPELDIALEALTDYCSERPKCGGTNTEPEYSRDVELLDFGYRRG